MMSKPSLRWKTSMMSKPYPIYLGAGNGAKLNALFRFLSFSSDVICTGLWTSTFQYRWLTNNNQKSVYFYCYNEKSLFTIANNQISNLLHIICFLRSYWYHLNQAASSVLRNNVDFLSKFLKTGLGILKNETTPPPPPSSSLSQL